ncbi:MAG: TatD family hydrolase [Acidobacteriota bacterium]|jgi:TatD DNase family protein|nr:TatD family hydrolase [Acidobacteriota bacterium]
MKLIDSHCHIDGEKFDEDRDEVIQNALDAGVAAMLNVGTGSANDDSFEKTVELAEKYDCVFGSVGIHPHDASEYTDEVEKRLIHLLTSSKKIIAWGEIGLDYYYEHSPRDVQIEVFRRQINVAKVLDLPIIIHSRDANDETVRILREECSHKDFRGGVMHCFGGTAEMALDLMGIGFLISFAGNVTFKKADNLREAAKVVPLEKLLVETDCPYLTPVPFRGKRNEPARVVETARFLADFYEIEFEKLAEQTTKNFEGFFNLNL